MARLNPALNITPSTRPRARHARTVVPGVALALIAVGLSACAGSSGGSSGGADAPVKIGAVYSVTGNLSAYGNDVINGLKFYAKYTNAHGGIDGHKVQIDLKDDQSTPSVGQTVMREIAADSSVVATTGSELVPEAELLMKVAEAEHLPYLGDLLSLDNSYFNSRKYSYRASAWNDTDTVKAVLTQLKKLGDTNIAVLYPLDAGGQPGYTAIKTLAPQLGMKVVSAVNYPAGTANASVYALKAIATHPQAYVVWDQDTPTELGLVVKDLRSNGATQPIGTPEGASSPVFTQATGADVDKIYYWAGSSPTALPTQFKPVGAAMTAAGLKPDDYMLGGYSIGQVIGAASKAVLDGKGKLSKSSVNDAIQHLTSVPTIYGPVTYSPTNHAEPLSVVPIFERTNGTIVRADTPAGS